MKLFRCDLSSPQNLALNQEWIELDLFHYGLARFSVDEFEAAGLNAEDRFLIEYMADQEVGHAQLLTNILGPERAAKQCTYRYSFETVREFVDFCQKLTRFGRIGSLRLPRAPRLARVCTTAAAEHND